MAKSSKLVAAKRGRILLVRRRRDRLWMFPGGRRRVRETEKDCLRREIRKELPKLKLGRLKLWKRGQSQEPQVRPQNERRYICRERNVRPSRHRRQEGNRQGETVQAARNSLNADLALHP